MTTEQITVLIAVEVVLVATGVGLLMRGRWRHSRFFAAYVAVVFGCELMLVLAPSRFFVPTFWMAKQATYDVLKLAVALELAWRTFRVFPGAQAVARRAVLTVLALTTLAVMAAPIDSSDGDLFLIASGQLHPRVLNGTIWLMAATLALAHWFRVPLHSLHAALLTSFAAYLAVFGALLRLEGLYGWAAQPYLNALDPPAYLLLVCWWAYIAWRPETATGASHDAIIRKLELRTASCG